MKKDIMRYYVLLSFPYYKSEWIQINEKKLYSIIDGMPFVWRTVVKSNSIEYQFYWKRRWHLFGIVTTERL